MIKHILLSVQFVFCVCFLSLSLSAQNTESPLKEQKDEDIPIAVRFAEVHSFEFMGIPMRLSPAAFALTLKEKGFVQVNSEGAGQDGALVFSGDFAGNHDCKVQLFVIDGLIWKVGVTFPDEKFWMYVKERYFQFKDMYSHLYGEPALCEEALSRKFNEGSDLEKWGFENRYSKWRSRFDQNDGSILLEVRFNEKSANLYLAVDYIDRVRSIYKTNLELDDL